ncbi:molybdenum cofactor biosynthesis protein A [Xylanimonas cellulosilytica DSM 15894]|uniref:GTP 3',8-cyclase n=1 Tax=Xylanimonas cellulosilytica (strain DSM 15894 / JCM 12276 / CECT 5975 / KCTC 9989 / LMG 20990 / NBRC 107835 / XIL07) TaxID=446471 RepID=D1BT10_XYLCX|nr:GTP 3',8-cyclase MoaA [Xylanimonas cellulosilytica]ACZ30852.1 molybdenum cofactor biosynthesis protein A [Xylanimonas cellulosilytica DSM 15894]
MTTVALGMPVLLGRGSASSDRAPDGSRPDGAAPDRTGATTPADRPHVPGLVDRFGRTATDLRVSLTDRCNLRCTYCMPAEGLPTLPKDAVMSRTEIARLVGVATRELGVRQVRFTGGEPLLRADLVDIVRDVAALPQRPEISLTTNAVGLDHRARALRDAGLDRVNISLDTLDPDTFARLARRPFLERTLAGISAAAEVFDVIKINAVLVRGLNLDHAADLLAWCLERGFELRFIEQMPLDADHAWDRAAMVTAAEVRRQLGERFTLTADEEPRDGAPAERFVVRPGGGGAPLGRVGVIASVTEPFCGDCRRTRLTAEGAVRDCLFAHTETDLLGPLRTGADDGTLADLWRTAMWGKRAGHGMAASGFVQPARTMSAIGG